MKTTFNKRNTVAILPLITRVFPQQRMQFEDHSGNGVGGGIARRQRVEYLLDSPEAAVPLQDFNIQRRRRAFFPFEPESFFQDVDVPAQMRLFIGGKSNVVLYSASSLTAASNVLPVLPDTKPLIRAIKLPKNGEKTIKFDTDVENDYFDRIDDPGDLEISLLQFRRNDATGGTEAGNNTDISGLLNITKSSPNQGTIKLSLSPRGELQVGDQVEIKVSLSAPGEPLEEILLVKIADNEAPKEKALQEKEEDDSIGLPALEKVHKDNWEQLEGNGIAMDHDTVKNIQFGVRQRFVHSFFVCKVRHYALLNSCAKYCISTNTNLVGGLLGGLSGGEECSTSCSSVRVLKSAAECVFGQKKNLRNRLIL